MAKKRKSTFEDARKKNESGTPGYIKKKKKTKIGVIQCHNVPLRWVHMTPGREERNRKLKQIILLDENLHSF